MYSSSRRGDAFQIHFAIQLINPIKPANLLVKGDSLLTQQSLASLASLTIEHSIEHSMASAPQPGAARLLAWQLREAAPALEDNMTLLQLSEACQELLNNRICILIMYIVYNNYVNIYIMLIYIIRYRYVFICMCVCCL